MVIDLILISIHCLLVSPLGCSIGNLKEGKLPVFLI